MFPLPNTRGFLSSLLLHASFRVCLLPPPLDDGDWLLMKRKAPPPPWILWLMLVDPACVVFSGLLSVPAREKKRDIYINNDFCSRCLCVFRIRGAIGNGNIFRVSTSVRVLFYKTPSFSFVRCWRRRRSFIQRNEIIGFLHRRIFSSPQTGNCWLNHPPSVGPISKPELSPPPQLP